MSTQIKRIKGYYFYDNKQLSQIATINVNRFIGKTDSMIQLTLSGGEHTEYICLNRKQVKQLIKTLKNAFDLEKYPQE